VTDNATRVENPRIGLLNVSEDISLQILVILWERENKKMDHRGGVCIGLIWLRIGTCVGLYWTKKNKLRGPSSASELYRLNDRHLSTKFSANFCGYRDVAWSARRNPYGR
jgi:hypothetical protein